MTKVLTGGCQCGAVRFRVASLGRASICHCRMCQKATGNFYAPLVVAHGIVWTRGEPAWFHSSNHVRRGHCAACGTPLLFEDRDETAIMIGAFDAPTDIVPDIQYGTESKLPYVDQLEDLPERPTMGELDQPDYLKTLVSYQHPDHDTADWPAGTERR